MIDTTEGCASLTLLNFWPGKRWVGLAFASQDLYYQALSVVGVRVMNDRPVASLRVAVLEDELALRERVLMPGLARYGFDVVGYASVSAFLAASRSDPPDLLVLDVGLPDGDGFSVARQLRLEAPGMGIIMLTSRSDVVDRIRGLTEGADAFFSKPVDIDLLSAALHSLARRLGTRTADSPRSGAWMLSEDGWGLISPNGAAAALTRGERAVCQALFRHPAQLVTRQELIEAMTSRAEDFDDHRLDAMIHRLRSKARKRCGSDLPLISVHGRGYRLDPKGRMEV